MIFVIDKEAVRFKMKTLRELLQAAQIKLREQEIADADVDAWYLLTYVFQLSRAEFLLNQNKISTLEDEIRFFDLIEQRANHIPLQHITGVQEFMGLEFHVSKDVLIPRQDTESLVEEAWKVSEHKSVIDMCTGSGCIIISLAKLCSLSKAVGVDISEKALSIARKNAKELKADVEFIQSNLFDGIQGEFDIVISNPPYIPTKEIETLMPEVKNHEPILALDGSQDGLLFYHQIALEAKDVLKKDGYIFFEIGYNQGQEVKEILQTQGFYDIKIKKDLSGLDRVVIGRRS